MQERVVAAWYEPRPTLAAWLAWPSSLVFGFVSRFRRAMYARGFARVERMPVPVVVVGNITAGGSGKTPLVIALAQALRERGFHPGVVSRGHGGHGGVHAVTPDSDPAIVGDEPPIVAAAGFPMYVGRKRAAAVRALLAAHPACDVVICDDGLQHYALARDVEIAVVDAARGLGNGLLMPAGPLREPEERLDEVDAVVRLVSGTVPHEPQSDGRSTFMTHEPLPWRNVRDPQRSDDGARFARRRRACRGRHRPSAALFRDAARAGPGTGRAFISRPPCLREARPRVSGRSRDPDDPEGRGKMRLFRGRAVLVPADSRRRRSVARRLRGAEDPWIPSCLSFSYVP